VSRRLGERGIVRASGRRVEVGWEWASVFSRELLPRSLHWGASLPMFARVLHLFLCVVLAGPLSVPGWALARPENCVGGPADFPSTCVSESPSQVAEPHQASLVWVYDFTSGMRKYLYADPVDLGDPSGYYSSYEQVLGCDAEEAIQDLYEVMHPGDIILKSKRVFRKDKPGSWLFPDIFNTSGPKWLELKPLSVPGVFQGEAKRRLNQVALAGSPDVLWVPPLVIELATGERIICMNIGGVVYYQEKDLVEKTLEVAIASGIAYTAKDLLKYVAQRAATAGIQAGLRPVLVYSTSLAIGANAADKGRGPIMTSIASLLSLIGGF